MAGCVAGMLVLCATGARAEYVLLRSGARLNVTGYQVLGDKYRLQIAGGTVDVAADDVMDIEPVEIFEAIPVPLGENTPFHEVIRSAAARYGVDADLIHCVIAVESNFNPKAISRKNARGLMQLLPQTAARLGVKNIFDPQENVDAGTRYLRDLLTRYDNNMTLALAAYNAGPERVEQYGRRVPPYRETMGYVQRIARDYAKVKSARAGK
jgi:Transglycosylase SLT domain